MSRDRIARGVYQASRCQRPACIPVGRPRGAKAAGLRYERALAAALPQAEHGAWFEYRDANGPGYCQPDLLLHLPSITVVLEIKYTWTDKAYDQIEKLYLPVLQIALGKPVIGMQICKKLVPQAAAASRICSMLGNGLILAHRGERVAMQWLEGTPVMLMPTPDQLLALKPAFMQQVA